MPVAVNNVAIKGAGLQVFATLDLDTTELPTGGNATFDEVAVPKRPPIIQHTGTNARRVTLGLLFDFYRSGASTRNALSALETLAEPVGAMRPPPKVSWDTGGLLAHDETNDPGEDWWIEDLAFPVDDLLARGHEPVRQRATVQLVQALTAEKVAKRSVAQRADPPAVTSPQLVALAQSVARPYVVRAGDTLRRIAQQQLGDSDRWADLKALNPSVVDPNTLAQGTTLRIPRK